MRLMHCAVAALCLALPAAASAESLFNFENVLVGTSGTFSTTVNGVTATFGGSASVCASTGLNGNLFTTLTGNALMQGFCTPTTSGPLTIAFDQSILQVSFAVALNGTDSLPVLVQFYNRGAKVAERTVVPVVPTGGVSPEGLLTYTGTFDSIQITSNGLVALDNLDVIPMPASPFGTIN